ncbi:MAG: DEAD/DEAH box helicase [Bacteroidales bacterium]|nr:DEAD/DEAH box helicase [Bacteroidales bacterium]
MKFKDFNFCDEVMDGIDAVGYDNPTPVQEQAIPPIMDKKDVIACAQTGTGKTAAYVLPLLHNVISKGGNHNRINALIISPTRELAIQIDQQLEGFSYFAGVSSVAVYGGGTGTAFDQERKAIREGADVIVATPGRLMSHLNMGYVKLDKLETLILDEADRMLDMGFLADIQRIISFLPENRQTLMFSATMPEEIRKLARKVMHNPIEINLAVSKPAENVLQGAYLVYDNQKNNLIRQLIQGKDDLKSVLIFSATKSSVKELEHDLKRMKFNVKAIHSDLDQSERNNVLQDFKNRKTQILVATDIVSRGIDIDNISLVINYNVPHDAEDYVHRVGRTARAEKTGVALTFINQKEIGSFKRIEKFIGSEVRKISLPADLGEGPSYEDKGRTQGKPGRKPFKFRKKGNPRT